MQRHQSAASSCEPRKCFGASWIVGNPIAARGQIEEDAVGTFDQFGPVGPGLFGRGYDGRDLEIGHLGE
jgi:hypothetical protein